MPGGRFGLLGRKLGHSYSPEIHGYLGDYDYRRYEVEPEELDTFLKTTDLNGMNVTIPYKKTVMDYCTEISGTALRMGAVNVLVKHPDGWHGDNTDYDGFCALVRKSGIDVTGKKALVLGSGGASGTACRALEDLGAGRIVVISRSGADNYTNLDRHADAGIIVNTTPVGMFPDNGNRAVDLREFPRCSGVIDVIYNPSRTALLLQAEELGIPCAGGLYMLVAQAKRASELFTGSSIDDSVNDMITGKLEARMLNIIIVGMPGAGKSSVARSIANITGRRLVETDEEIVKRAGKSIPEIFREQGEDGFRALETLVMAEAGKQSGCVISTGGGCVTRAGNYPLLHQNGRIFWIQRELKKLPVSGRPISQANPLEKLYEERHDKYEAFSDYIIDNDGRLKDTVREIITRSGIAG